MPVPFVPFFQQLPTPAAPSQETFQLYSIPNSPADRTEASPPPAEKTGPPKFSTVTLVPRAQAKKMDRSELKSKLLADLKSAVALALPQEVIQQITHSLELLHDQPSSPASLPSPGGDHHPRSTQSKPNLHVQKEGDQVTAIIVECRCGEVISLDCIY